MEWPRAEQWMVAFKESCDRALKKFLLSPLVAAAKSAI
jgi:hypothetical protein